MRKFLAIQLVSMAACAQVPLQSQAQPPGPAPKTQPQTPVAPLAPLAPVPTVEDLKILVLEGQRSVNDTARHIGVQPVVEVRDQNDRPVEGATVVFRLPPSGPGGAFAGNSLTYSARTNAQGQAGANGFVPNDQLGRFDIHVTATLANQIGQATISSTNSPNSLVLVPPEKKRKSIWRNKYIWIGVAAAGATAAVVLVLESGHSSTPTVTITPGPVTIGQ